MIGRFDLEFLQIGYPITQVIGLARGGGGERGFASIKILARKRAVSPREEWVQSDCLFVVRDRCLRAFFIFHLPAEGVFLQSLERVGRGLAQWNIEFFPPDDTPPPWIRAIQRNRTFRSSATEASS